MKRNGFRKPFHGSAERSCGTKNSPQETLNKQTSKDELRSTFETARVKTAFVSSLSYFSGRAQSKSGGKEGRRGSAITLIRKKCPGKETERTGVKVEENVFAKFISPNPRSRADISLYILSSAAMPLLQNDRLTC